MVEDIEPKSALNYFTKRHSDRREGAERKNEGALELRMNLM